MTAWLPAEVAEVIERRARGESMFDIARALGRHPGSVSGKIFALKLGPSPSTRRVHWSAAEMAALRELWPRASRKEVMAALPNRAWSAIGKRASSLGLLRSAHRRYPKVHPMIAQLRTERERLGWSRPQLAKRVGVHRQQIATWELGIAQPLWFFVETWAEALGFELRLWRK